MTRPNVHIANPGYLAHAERLWLYRVLAPDTGGLDCVDCLLHTA